MARRLRSRAQLDPIVGQQIELGWVVEEGWAIEEGTVGPGVHAPSSSASSAETPANDARPTIGLGGDVHGASAAAYSAAGEPPSGAGSFSTSSRVSASPWPSGRRPLPSGRRLGLSAEQRLGYQQRLSQLQGEKTQLEASLRRGEGRGGWRCGDGSVGQR